MPRTTIFAALLVVPLLTAAATASAQTSDPYTNMLLGQAREAIAGAKATMRDIQSKDQNYRMMCWQGVVEACQALDNLLLDPNYDAAGNYIQPPAGAYWPF